MKVSIITVVRNNEDTIKDAIESVLSQTYTNIEYIVIDGASTDETLNIIQPYIAKITTLVSERDGGIYDAMNKGIELASGDIVGILNSDDFYTHSKVIDEVVRKFIQNPGSDLVLGNVDFVRPDNLFKPIRFYSSFKFALWKMRFGFMPAHPSAFIKRSAYNRIGQYKVGYKIGADFDMFVRLLVVARLPYVKLNKTLIRMRVGGVSTSGIKSYVISTNEMLCSLKENQIYSNSLMVSMRLPIKLIQLLLNK